MGRYNNKGWSNVIDGLFIVPSWALYFRPFDSISHIDRLIVFNSFFGYSITFSSSLSYLLLRINNLLNMDFLLFFLILFRFIFRFYLFIWNRFILIYMTEQIYIWIVIIDNRLISSTNIWIIQLLLRIQTYNNILFTINIFIH